METLITDASEFDIQTNKESLKMHKWTIVVPMFEITDDVKYFIEEIIDKSDKNLIIVDNSELLNVK